MEGSLWQGSRGPGRHGQENTATNREGDPPKNSTLCEK